MKLRNRSSFHARFFCFFYVFSLCSFACSCVLMRTFIFLYTSYTFFIIFFFSFLYLHAIFTFIYLSCAFLLFYLLSMRLLVLSSTWEKGHLGFVCCFSAFSSISAFFYCFFFSCFTKAPFLLSPLSSFLFSAKRLHFFFLSLLRFLSKKAT